MQSLIPPDSSSQTPRHPRLDQKSKHDISHFPTTSACHILGVITLELLTWLSALKEKNLKDSGEFSLSSEALVTMLEGKLKMDCFSQLRLPSHDDVTQAPQNVIDRLHAVKSIDVDALRFTLAGNCGSQFDGRPCVQRCALDLGALHPGSGHRSP